MLMTPLTVIVFTLDLQGKVPGESKFTFFLNFFLFFFTSRIWSQQYIWWMELFHS